jgi:hypothetical protein
MNDIEQLVDTWVNRVVAYHAGSDTSLKCACIVAAQVVGSYSGTTQLIAKETKRSVSSIENWAHGFWLYKELRANGSRTIARKLWRELPASHWWKAYDIQRAGYDAAYYLLFAFQHSVSGRGMMGEFEKDRNAGNAPLVFSRAKIAIYGLAVEMMKHKSDMTPEQIAAITAVRKAFE